MIQFDLRALENFKIRNFQKALDKQPEMKTADKGHIWKANYHQFQAMAHSIKVLADIQKQ